MENLYIIIGERIRKKRREIKVNQQYLADKVDINRTSISNIEKGRHQPPLHLLYKICYHLDMEIEYLLPSIDDIISTNDTKQETPSLFTLLRSNTDLSEDSKNDLEILLNNLD